MIITVKTLTGKSLSFSVEPSDQIITIKQQIEQKEGISIDQQKLLFSGKQLDDNNTLDYYDIPDNSTLHLILRLRTEMQIHIRFATGNVISLQTQLFDTIGYLKKKIEEKDRIPIDQQRLFFNGQSLDDRKTLNSYGIQPNATLELALRLHTEFEIYVKTLRGSRFDLNVQSTDSVHSVKQKIQEKEGIPANCQKLLFDGQPLDDTKTLSECNISRHSELCLIINLPRKDIPKSSFTPTTIAIGVAVAIVVVMVVIRRSSS